MMNYLGEYILFLAKFATSIGLGLVGLAGLIGLLARSKAESKGQLKAWKYGEKQQLATQLLQSEILDKKSYKLFLKRQKKNASNANQPCLFVLRFNGDIKASAVGALREEITAILSVASKHDEVLVILESPGGLVSPYGLAASQLARIRDNQIKLTVSVDKIAASGGYLMACVANEILAAPFAIIGSIGVVAQLPNFNKLLKKMDIDYELHTAGPYKRSLTLFGENTDKAREKFKEDIHAVYQQFKDHITLYRPSVDIQKVATGEYWLGNKAKGLHLVDKIQTSDDYLLSMLNTRKIIEMKFHTKKNWVDKFTQATASLTHQL